MLSLNPVISCFQLNAFSAIQALHEQLESRIGADSTEIKTEQEFHAFVKKMIGATASFDNLSRFAMEVEVIFGTIYVHNAALSPEQRFHLDWWSMVSQKALQLLAVLVVFGMKSTKVISPSLGWALEQCRASLSVLDARSKRMDQLAVRISDSLRSNQ
jgi:hypothetical protein